MRLPKWPRSLPTKPAETAIFVHTDALPLAAAVVGPKAHKDLCKRKVPEAECLNNWTMLVLFSTGCTRHLLKCSAAGLKRDENDGDCNDVTISKSTFSCCTFPFYVSSNWIWKPSALVPLYLVFLTFWVVLQCRLLISLKCKWMDVIKYLKPLKAGRSVIRWKKNMHIAHQRRQPGRIQLVLSGVQCSRGLAVNHLTSKDREFRSFKFNIYEQRKWVNPIAAAVLSSERRYEKCMLEQNHRTSGSPRPRCMSEESNPATYREKYVRSLKGTGPVLFFFFFV